eukprot:1363505-Amorphochlora_amoeboformis.AAC.1
MKTFVENEAFGGFSKMPANMTSVDIPSDNRQKRNSTLELTGSVRAERQHSMSPLKTEITSLGGARAKDLRGYWDILGLLERVLGYIWDCLDVKWLRWYWGAWEYACMSV